MADTDSDSIYSGHSWIETSIESDSKDIFDEVFEADEEEKAAKKKLHDKAEELKKAKEKKLIEELTTKKVEQKKQGEEAKEETGKETTESTNDNETDSDEEEDKEETNEDDETDSTEDIKTDEIEKKSQSKNSNDEDDEDEEIEEDEKENTEPIIFGEVKEREDDEFETKDEAFDAVDAGGAHKKSKNNFDDLVKEGLEKSLAKNNITSNRQENKGMGGKLDLKIVQEDSEEEEESSPVHPAEKQIIKSVIKNKALMAAQNDVKIKRGKKISDDTLGKPKTEEGEEHDELADALLREDGIREEGIEEPIEDEEMEEENEGPRMPRAKILEEEEEATAEDKSGKIMPSLEFLMTKNNKAFIGRKKSVLGKYGEEAGLFVGRVNEKEKEDTDVLLDGLNPHVVFVCGARGSGKCLTGDTLITLNTGEVIPIKELENHPGEIFALNNNLKITPSSRTGFYKRTVNKTMEIILQSGKKIELTPEHPLLTVNGWKPAEEFTKGERIATPRILPAFGTLKMKEIDVKLLAYFIAEGHLDNQFVLFSNMNDKINGEFKECISQFDPNLRIEMHSKKGCFRVAQIKKKVDTSHLVRDKTTGRFTKEGYILMEHSSIRKWLENIGLYGKLAADKFIPKEVMMLEKEQLTTFLNRLFSCDGTIYRINKGTNWSVSIGFSSKKLTQQVQHLLLRYGILSTFRNKINKQHGRDIPSYELVVYGENVIKYIQEIGFFGYKEEKATIAICEMITKKRNPNLDTIPKEIWNMFPVSNWKKMARELGYAPQSFHNTKNYSPTREKLLKMAQIECNAGIEMLAQSDIYWDTIKEIKEINTETEVYDITVPELHNFVANEIIVHNSYVLGVIAEELALKNKNVGIVVVDPIGVFWSMKHPNKEEKELEALTKWGMLPRGLDNIKVFIPVGMKDSVPKSTYDAVFSIQPALLTAEDWCLTFGIDRFSPTGLLMEKGIAKVKAGYTTIEGKEIRGKQNTFSLEDLIRCFENDAELNDKERGYKSDSIRALASRFDAAKHWGIFDDKGTSLGLISRAGQMTILDTSFLEDNVGALVIGIISRRLLAARKLGTRREAAGKFDDVGVEEVTELNIPPTWLFIDEAHTLIPAGNQKTPASNALVEYVKQGRRPGCSLVFATQQPSAIDSKVLSQLDVIMAHKLVFDDDIKSIYKRTPAIVPHQYKKANFIKTMPVGIALTGDRSETTSRAFVMAIRPRMSQHEGRDAETTEVKHELEQNQVELLAVNIVLRQLEKDPSIRMDSIKETLDTLNNTYKKSVELAVILELLKKKGVNVKPDAVFAAGAEEELLAEKEEFEEDTYGQKMTKGKAKLGEGLEEFEEEIKGFDEKVELTALQAMINEQRARQLISGNISKKFLFVNEEFVDRVNLKYSVIYKVRYKYFSHKDSFHSGEAYINSLTGEFIHDDRGALRESKGLLKLLELSESETIVLKLVAEKKRNTKDVATFMKMEEGNAKRILDGLVKKNYLAIIEQNGKAIYAPSNKLEMDLPPSPIHDMLPSIGKRPITEIATAALISPNLHEKEVPELLKKLWGNVVVKEITHLFLPVWEGTLKKKTGEERTILIDAINGNKINSN
jgi:intein/homing endonuclease